jgi:hypothetical protein
MSTGSAFSKWFNPKMLSRAGQIAASDTAALKAFDKAMLHEAKTVGGGAGSKALKAYGKYFMTPAYGVSRTMYGSKADGAKLLGMLGGSAGVAYGGAAGRPFLSSISALANKISPTAMENMASPGLDSTLNLIRPGVALASKPAVMLDQALHLGGLAAEHPLISAGLAVPAAVYAAGRGGGALLNVARRSRRLAQLRKGIAPKQYRSLAQQIGFK